MKTTRRTALCVLGAATTMAAVGSVAGCDDDANSQPQGTFDLGDAASLAVGATRTSAEAVVVLARDADGLYAYSMICTHEGCIIGAPGADGIAVCPCHSARFDRNGTPISGPAPTALPHFAVAVTGGRAMVTTSMVVAAATRTTV